MADDPLQYQSVEEAWAIVAAQLPKGPHYAEEQGRARQAFILGAIAAAKLAVAHAHASRSPRQIRAWSLALAHEVAACGLGELIAVPPGRPH